MSLAVSRCHDFTLGWDLGSCTVMAAGLITGDNELRNPKLESSSKEVESKGKIQTLFNHYFWLQSVNLYRLTRIEMEINITF